LDVSQACDECVDVIALPSGNALAVDIALPNKKEIGLRIRIRRVLDSWIEFLCLSSIPFDEEDFDGKIDDDIFNGWICLCVDHDDVDDFFAVKGKDDERDKIRRIRTMMTILGCFVLFFLCII
jgi:hypothetical protein